MNLVSQNEAAKRLDVSRRSVQVAAATGRISLVGGKVDMDSVAGEWQANTDTAHLSGINTRGLGTRPATRGRTGLNAPGANGKATKDATYYDVRTEQKQLELELMQLRLDKERGSMVSRADVEAQRFADHQAARDRMAMIPDRVAAIFAAESDPKKIHAELTREIREACHDVAQGG